MLTPKPELRYGCPAADRILFNPFFTVGYSYYFRQAKWALQLISLDKEDKNEGDKNKVERNDSFRSDYRIPQIFRVDPKEHKYAMLATRKDI